MAERTLIIIKPDSIQRHLAGETISRFEKKVSNSWRSGSFGFARTWPANFMRSIGTAGDWTFLHAGGNSWSRVERHNMGPQQELTARKNGLFCTLWQEKSPCRGRRVHADGK
ncbi:MAG: nucleoside-diphosphate kinase [Planctomycetota bacterium]